MKIIEDEARLDALQTHLTYEIIRAVHHELERTKVAKSKIREVIGAVTFQVCAVLDCSHEMNMDGVPVRPGADVRGRRGDHGGHLGRRGIRHAQIRLRRVVDDYFERKPGS